MGRGRGHFGEDGGKDGGNGARTGALWHGRGKPRPYYIRFARFFAVGG